ncbi:hypothetical protein WMF38_31380 [Sorangium sp. So ce118]
MANTSAIHSVSESIITFLRKRYPQELSDRHSADFQLLASGRIRRTRAAPSGST